MIQQKILQLFTQFQIEKSQLKRALQCGSSPAHWENYIKHLEDEIINPTKSNSFRQRLYDLGILENNNIEKQHMKPFEVILQDILQEIGEDSVKINSINSSSINQYRWGTKLLNEIETKSRVSIDQDIEIAADIAEFLSKQMALITDILFRRVSLKSYFNQVILASRNQKNKHPLCKLISEMTFADFIICLIKTSKSSSIIAALISDQGIPLPIMYQIKERIQYDQKLIFDVLGNNQYSLILNIGTPKMPKNKKTQMVAKLFSIKQEDAKGSHLSNTLNLYTKVKFGDKENIIVADFNGQVSNETNQDVCEIIRRLASFVSILIIHAHQQQIMDGIFGHDSFYVQLMKSAQKVIIYLRDKQVVNIKRLNAKNSFNSEHIYLKLFDSQQTSKYINEYQTITNFPLASKFSYEAICNNNSKAQLASFNDMVNDEAIGIVHRSNCSKFQITPNLSYMQQFQQISIKIRQQLQSQELICQYQQKLKVIKSLMEVPILTNFIKKAIQIIQTSQQFRKMFEHTLLAWKQFDKKRESSERYQLSIDKIFKELIIYNQKFPSKPYSNLIQNFYSKSFEDISPINIIDGQTLIFGNNSLKQTIAKLSERYLSQKKKIFVVSVIGSQSSAKSTLMNYLFRCKFETSAGRCTKGVYMSLCQIDNFVIIVLDTQGLLSIKQRDSAFDHQIATFILKISDLVIINNKGELTSTLKDMLEVCLYVLKALHKDQNNKDFAPQKIIFAIRDQRNAELATHQQASTLIQASLEKMSQYAQYKQFFNIESNDVFSMPSAFISAQALKGTIERLDPNFGECILGMRTRIIRYLSELQPQNQRPNLRYFYENASSVWETIQKCGKNIMHYKSYNEIVEKKKLEQRFNREIPKIMQSIQAFYENFFKKLAQIENYSEDKDSEYETQLIEIKSINQPNVIKGFEESCKEISSAQTWIKQFSNKIKAIFRNYENMHLSRLATELSRQKAVLKNNNIEKELTNLILNLLKQQRTDQEIIAIFKSNTSEILKRISAQFQTSTKSSKSHLRQVFQNIISYQNYSQLKIQHIEDCQSKFQKLKCQQSILEQIHHLFRFFQFSQTEDQLFLRQVFEKVLSFFQANISTLLSNELFFTPSGFYKVNEIFISLIAEAINEGNQMILTKKQSKRITLYEPTFKIILFGKLYKMVQQKIIEFMTIQHIKFYSQIERQVLFYLNDLQNILKVNGDVKQYINQTIQIVCKLVQISSIQKCQQIIKAKLDNLSMKLTPESIFSKAMSATLLQEQSGKQHYINCYKMVKNINRYLFEIMCESHEISTRSSIIADAIETVTSNIKKRVNYILNKHIQNGSHLLSKVPINKVLINIEELGIVFGRKKTLNQNEILSRLQKDIEERQIIIFQNIKIELAEHDFIGYVNSLIKGQLMKKVIGCSKTCPICGMKCMLQNGHSSNHKVLQNCHSICAFSKARFESSSESVLWLCQQKNNILAKWKHSNDQPVERHLKAYIKKYFPDWQNDFPDIHEQSRLQQITDVVKQKRIWANIEAVVIATIHKQKQPSRAPEIKALRDKYELTLDDLETEYEDPLTKEKYFLKDY